jgi:hypothetical protein
MLRITNKAELGWQVKTRSEREIPLSPCLVDVLRGVVGVRTSGPVFLRKRIVTGHDVVTAATPGEHLAFLVSRLDESQEAESDRGARLRLTKKTWWASGALTNEIIRREFVEEVGGAAHQHYGQRFCQTAIARFLLRFPEVRRALGASHRMRRASIETNNSLRPEQPSHVALP